MVEWEDYYVIMKALVIEHPKLLLAENKGFNKTLSKLYRACTGSGLLLWQHEFFMVVERDPYRGCPKPYLYQALEFRVGSQMPPEEVKALTNWKRLPHG
jgi:hypothetical protein